MYPRLLHIYGPLWIQSYGAMIAIGFLVFLYFSSRDPLRKKLISQEAYLNTVFVGLVSAVIGGRLLYILTHVDEFAGRWIETVYPWTGGLVVLGAIVGVLVGVTTYLRINRVPVLPLFDLGALYAPLMQSIARFGCLFAGCCYGAYAPHLWWAITFTNPDGYAPLYAPLHPTQIYMSLISLGIFVVLKMLASHLLTRPGTMLATFLMLENLARFTIDFWRGDRETLVAGLCGTKLSYFQYLSLAGFVLSGGLLIALLIRDKKR